MKVEDFLTKVITLPGLPGHEQAVGTFVKEAFAPYCQESAVDAMQNVTMTQTGAHGGPRVVIMAHMDEIGLIVTDIEDGGFIRFHRMGGVDPRILPGLTVTVHGAQDYFGVVGMKPPHLTSAAEAKKALKMDELYIDLGLPADVVRANVTVGDTITMHGAAQKLDGNILCGKTLDDRAGIAVMLVCAGELANRNIRARVDYVSTSQEEVGCRGATVAAHSHEPDLGIAIDVTHAKQPGAKPFETVPLDKIAITVGPNIHPGYCKKLTKVADERGYAYTIEPASGPTGTDARALQIARDGIPAILLGMPMKYMHTTVELIDMKVVKETGRLLADFIATLGEEEEGACC